MVLNYPPRPAGDPEGGPCYRCMYPKPPPPESVMTCGEGGILGPVVGVMGILQALETIKLIASGVMEIKMGGDCQPGVISCAQPVPSPQWLLFSGYSSNPVRSFRMRRRQKSCAACSAQATVTRDLLVSGSMDYLQFCGVLSPINALSEDERVSSNEFAAIRSSRDAGLSGHKASCTSVLIDTRDPTQFDLCHLHGSINISFAEIAATVPEKKDISEAQVEPNGNNGAAGWLQKIRELPFDVPIYVVCRLGNDSQLAVQKFKELGLDVGGRRQIRDISGGLKAWRDQVDPDFPKY